MTAWASLSCILKFAIVIKVLRKPFLYVSEKMIITRSQVRAIKGMIKKSYLNWFKISWVLWDCEDEHCHKQDNYVWNWSWMSVAETFVPNEISLQHGPQIWRHFLLQHSWFEVITSECAKDGGPYCHSWMLTESEVTPM